MAAEWYYAKNKQKVGPVTFEQLKELAGSGELSPADMVWKQGMAKWTQAGQVERLFGTATIAPTPPPLPDDEVEPLPVGKTPVPAKNPMPARFPWDTSEREKPNPALKFGTWGVIGVAILALLLFLTPAAILGLWLLGVVVLFSVFWIRLLWGLTLRGRWLPLDGQPGWVEFLPGNIFKKEDGTVASYLLLPNQRFIDIFVSGQLADSWKLLARGDSNLEVQDMTGRVRSFKKGKTFAEKQESFFHQDRTDDLPGTWMPIDGSGKWVQFSKDGAIVFSNGGAGRYSIMGEEPNEVIRITMTDGSAREYRLMSLSKAQLVIVEGGEARTYSRHTPKTSAAKPSASSKKSSATTAEPPTEQTSGHEAGRVLAGVWNWLKGYSRCRRCGVRKVKKTDTSDWEEGQRVETTWDQQTRTYRQMVVNYGIREETYSCEACGHTWEERRPYSTPA
ncbi:MAG TPA: DUF4339 domain-containing protein [Gemmataceae bacterium]|jgi:hypothetical protein